MKMIITGPDGVGKTSICRNVSDAGFEIRYGGKRRKAGGVYNIAYFLVRAFANVPILNSLVRSIFYFIEYRDLVNNSAEGAVYDRHFCDRFIFECNLKAQISSSIFQSFKIPELFLLTRLIRQYVKLLKISGDIVVVLIADIDQLAVRAGEEYQNVSDIMSRRSMYIELHYLLSSSGVATYLLDNNNNADAHFNVCKILNILEATNEFNR